MVKEMWRTNMDPLPHLPHAKIYSQCVIRWRCLSRRARWCSSRCSFFAFAKARVIGKSSPPPFGPSLSRRPHALIPHPPSFFSRSFYFAFLSVFGSMQLVDASLWLLSRTENLHDCSPRNHFITRVALYTIMAGMRATSKGKECACCRSRCGVRISDAVEFLGCATTVAFLFCKAFARTSFFFCFSFFPEPCAALAGRSFYERKWPSIKEIAAYIFFFWCLPALGRWGPESVCDTTKFCTQIRSHHTRSFLSSFVFFHC